MTSREKAVLALALVLVLSVLALLVVQRARTGDAQSQLEEARMQLALQQHESTLAVAAIEAVRGSFEISRQLASDFFSGLQQDVNRAPEAARAEFSNILTQRDAMITALSRSDPQAAPQLIQLLIRYRLAMGEPVGPQTPAAQPAPVTTPPADSLPQ